MLIFIKVNGLRSKTSALSKYQKIQKISMSHTFSNLLYFLLDKHKASETLSKPDISDML
jgi:hypothetical protein